VANTESIPKPQAASLIVQTHVNLIHNGLRSDKIAIYNGKREA